MDLSEGLLLYHNTSHDGETLLDGETRSETLVGLELAFNVLSFIMVAVGIVGNSVVIISGWRLPMLRKKSVTTGSRYYIMNLALADLGVMVVAAITNVIFLRHSWALGSFMCKMLLPLRDVFMLVSLATMPALSLERYWLITRPPLQHVPNKSAPKFVIFGIWLVSYLINGVPLLLITRLLEKIGEVKSCEYVWPSATLMKAHICFGLVMILATFAIVAFCYIAIAKTLKEIYKERRSTMGYDIEGNKHEVTLILRSKRLVKMLVVVVVTFSICTLPGVSYVLAHVFYDVTFKNQEILYMFFNGMMIVGSALNPVILLMMASEYRSCLVEWLQLVKKWRTRCCSCKMSKKEPLDQPYHEILRDNNLPSTPV